MDQCVNVTYIFLIMEEDYQVSKCLIIYVIISLKYGYYWNGPHVNCVF
jgi:hypothetical protein